jgi:hypothetical protein
VRPQTKTKSPSKKEPGPTQKLAYYLWKLQGNEGDIADAFKDVLFVKRYLSMSKKMLASGADLETTQVALDLMVKDGIVPYSPQQTIDWTFRRYNKSYYEVAKDVIKARDKPPPIYFEAAFEEWYLAHDRRLHRGSTDSNLHDTVGSGTGGEENDQDSH